VELRQLWNMAWFTKSVLVASKLARSALCTLVLFFSGSSSSSPMGIGNSLGSCSCVPWVRLTLGFLVGSATAPSRAGRAWHNSAPCIAYGSTASWPDVAGLSTALGEARAVVLVRGRARPAWPSAGAARTGSRSGPAGSCRCVELERQKRGIADERGDGHLVVGVHVDLDDVQRREGVAGMPNWDMDRGDALELDRGLFVDKNGEQWNLNLELKLNLSAMCSSARTASSETGT